MLYAGVSPQQSVQPPVGLIKTGCHEVYFRHFDLLGNHRHFPVLHSNYNNLILCKYTEFQTEIEGGRGTYLLVLKFFLMSLMNFTIYISKFLNCIYFN